jgi:SAM-dependent methyltransferase
VSAGTGPAWRLDERAHAGDEHLDAGYVAGYDRKAGFDPTEDVEVLRRHGLGPASVVVDLGAGTGTFTAAVAPHCGRVVAVDVSPPMAAALRARARDLGLANITVVEAGFVAYEHAGPPADAVYTRNALHQVPDFWKGVALDRIAGLLRPGGVLRLRDLVYDFDPAEAAARIEAWLAGAVDDPAVGWTAAELAHHVRTEFSTYAWLLEPMLDRCGFDVVERSFRRGTYGTYTCLRR